MYDLKPYGYLFLWGATVGTSNKFAGLTEYLFSYFLSLKKIMLNMFTGKWPNWNHGFSNKLVL